MLWSNGSAVFKALRYSFELVTTTGSEDDMPLLVSPPRPLDTAELVEPGLYISYDGTSLLIKDGPRLPETARNWPGLTGAALKASCSCGG